MVLVLTFGQASSLNIFFLLEVSFKNQANKFESSKSYHDIVLRMLTKILCEAAFFKPPKCDQTLRYYSDADHQMTHILRCSESLRKKFLDKSSVKIT